MDDFYEDFDDSFEDGFDDGDFMDDSDGDFCDDSLNGEMADDSEQEDNGIDIGWEEVSMIGAMSEEIAEDEKRRRRIQKDMERKDGENSVV